MNRVKGRAKLLWDFDGTLAEAPFLWSRAVKGLLKESGVEPPDVRDIRRALSSGFPWHEWQCPHAELFGGAPFWEYVGALVRRVLYDFGAEVEDASAVGRRLRERILDKHGYRLLAGAVDVLERLTQQGYRHYIASNHIPELADLTEDLGLRRHFERVYTSGQIGFEKPHLSFFNHIIELEGQNEIVAMIGDNYTCDVLGARHAAIAGIWLDRDGSSGQDKSGMRIMQLSELPSTLTVLAT